jgi:hypothetical protein
MRQETEKIYGIPLWDLHSCDICGSVLLANTIKLHAEFHQTQTFENSVPKFATKNCPVCAEAIEIPLDSDGAMVLDIYDDHLETHEEE